MSVPEPIQARPFNVNDRPRPHEWVHVNLHAAASQAASGGKKRSLALPVIIVLVCVGGLVALAAMFLSGGSSAPKPKPVSSQSSAIEGSAEIKPAQIRARFGKKSPAKIEIIADVELSSSAKLNLKNPLEIDGLGNQALKYQVDERGSNRYRINAEFKPSQAVGQATIKDVRYSDGNGSLSYPEPVSLSWNFSPAPVAARRPTKSKPTTTTTKKPADAGLTGNSIN